MPLFLVYLIYFKLSPEVCYSPTNIESSKVEKLLSENLTSEFNRIQNLAPIIQFGGDWFKYDVSLENKFKVAFVSSAPNIYVEATTTLNIETKNGTSTIPYGKNIEIGSGIKAEEINDLITDLTITSQPLLVTPGMENLEVQTNNAWLLCLYINLQDNYKLSIWFVCLLFTAGTLALVKQIITFIYKDFWKYMRSE